MKKQLSTVALGLCLVASLAGFSQNEQKKIPCHTDEMMEDHFRRNPEARKSFEASQEKFREEFNSTKNTAGKVAATVYTIPVVFHILHLGGSENISDAACINALQWVNDDFAKAHGDASLTAAPFSSLYINSDIKMMLAKKDPNGNCTSGIVRHVDTKTNWNQGTAQSSGAYWAYTWDPTKYMNIYIVAQIIPQGTVTGGGIIVGYTYRPGTWGTGDPHDAIVYNSSFLNGSNARSLTHEMAHWFNLLHTWGGTNSPGISCSGDDFIADTPPTKGNFTGCPSSLSGNTCPGSGGIDNIQNIMNYSDCPINFTTDQTTAMRTALASGTSGRSNLKSAANLIATDITGTSPCAPSADFLSTNNNYTVCSGGSLTMKDASYNGTISTWAWSATGGASVTAPSNSLTLVSFPTVGTAVITLTVTNGAGSGTASRTVTVLDGTQGVPNNYYESFEAPGTPPNWLVDNKNPGSIEWEQTSTASSHGLSSFYINGPSNPPNHIDYLQMPIINPLDNPDDTVFTFKYAYARNTPTHDDKFEVQVSTNCGGTWATLVGLSASQMASGSGGVTAAPYVPLPTEWKKFIISAGGGGVDAHPNWFQYTGYKSLLVRFMFQEGATGFGNRIYLDELSFFSLPVGVNELTKSIHFSLYPNPTNGEATVKFSLNDPANIKIDVVDVVGKKVLPSTEVNYNAGEQSVTLNKGAKLSKGIYFVNLSLNGARMSKKLIIN